MAKSKSFTPDGGGSQYPGKYLSDKAKLRPRPYRGGQKAPADRLAGGGTGRSNIKTGGK